MPESAKEGARPLAESSDIGLGPGDRAFEPHYSDQNPSEIVDFRGIFLFFVYCGAEGEKRIFNVCQIENITEICYNIKKEV